MTMKQGIHIHQEAQPLLPLITVLSKIAGRSSSSSSSSSNNNNATTMQIKKSTFFLLLLITGFVLGLFSNSFHRMEHNIIRQADFTSRLSKVQVGAAGGPPATTGTISSSSCEHPFQIWPLLNVEKEVILQENAFTNTDTDTDTDTDTARDKGEEENIHTRQEFEVVTAKEEVPQACAHIFRPVHFFHNEHSPGYKYLHHLKHLANATGVTPLSRIGLHHLTVTKVVTGNKNGNSNSDGDDGDDGDHDDNGNQEVDEEYHLVYNSVPKSASRTLVSAMKRLNNKLQKSDYLNASYEFILTDGDNNNIMEAMELEQNSTSTKSSSSSLSPRPQSTKKFKLFGMMRDPVARFVSATAQEMAERSGVKAEVFRELCLKDNARDTLQCAIEQVRYWFTTKNLIRKHFNPSTVIFYERSYGHDVPIELFEFDALKGVESILLEDDLHVNSQHDKGTYHGHQQSDVVLNMSVSDLTQEMIEEICALYAIDVLLMRELDMEDKYCKGNVSDKYVSTLS